MFVLYENIDDLKLFNDILPRGYQYDVKYIEKNRVKTDFVFFALLQCRSAQISGDFFGRTSVKADQLFAWKHWVKYSPASIPDYVNTNSPASLIYFKLLTRCFGVISFLKYRKFSRDISNCIELSKSENVACYETLTKYRIGLEKNKSEIIDTRLIKLILKQSFDKHFDNLE